jgi:transcriptional regulator with XRE-family HTH domain
MKKTSVNFWKNVDDELYCTGKDRKELAHEAHFDVSNIGKGIKENNVPAVDTAYRIARALNVPLESLLDGGESPKTDYDTEKSEELSKFRKYRKVTDDLDALDESVRGPIITMIADLRKHQK